MSKIFMILENEKTTQLKALIDKIHLQRGDMHVALSDLSIYYTWKNIKKSYSR